MSESIFRTVLILSAQVAIAFAIGSLLWYFWRVYRRPYLQSWMISAYLFCISMLIVIGITAQIFDGLWERAFASFFAAIAHNLHIYLVLVGSYESVHSRSPSRKWLRSGLFVALLLPFLSIVSAFDPEAETLRYALRLGVRELVTTVAFLVSTYIVGFAQHSRTAGARLVAASFFLYGSAHGYFLWVITQNVMGINTELSPFFGVTETVLISWIGFSLVIWLLEDERNRLQKMNKEMDSFLYSTSHDLRAPIASILGITNLARLEVKDEKSLEYVGMIENRVKKLDLVISDILQLSRSANSEIKYGPIDFNKLVIELMTDIKFNQGAGSITLKYHEHENNTFFGDYHQMKIVLGNLLSNAVRYHRLDQPEPGIEVRFSKVTGKVVLEVEDNGEGIADEHQEKIFEMFYRASTKTEGTGLGLYIVKEALSRVKGSIDLQSKVGRGSTFRVTLLQ